MWLAAVVTLAAAGAGCRKSEPPVSTEPTAANPKPYPGMEEARGKASLRLPRGGAEEEK